MTKRKSGVWTGAEPYSVDLLKLKTEIGVPEEGTVISHETLSKIIGHASTSQRYKAVINSWRKRMYREHRLEITGQHSEARGVGLLVCTQEQRLMLYQDRTERTVKADIRSYLVGGTIRSGELEEQDQQQYKILHNEVAMRVQQGKQMMAIVAPKPIQALPRARDPEEAPKPKSWPERRTPPPSTKPVGSKRR
jgi:hypothetical protein